MIRGPPHLSAIERIARVLAAERLSINAEGYEPYVASEVCRVVQLQGRRGSLAQDAARA